jgi:hypothetical protein
MAAENTEMPTEMPTETPQVPEDEIQKLTFVNHQTHIQCFLPNVLIATSCTKGRNGFITYFTEASVRNCVQAGINEAKKKGYESPDPRFLINYPTVYDPVKKKKSPKGLAFVWFADTAFPNIFLGKNPDGSPRIEEYPDPNWVAPPMDNWDDEEEEEDTFDPSTFFNFKPGKSWADIQEEEEKKEAKKKKPEAPMLTRKLPPIATLIIKQGAEDPEPLKIEEGTSKIKKKIQDENDLHLLHLNIPSWADLSELLKTFSMFSTSGSYPILEAIRDNNRPDRCHLYVTYPPGSDCAITAQLILFRITCRSGKNEEQVLVEFAKNGSYDRQIVKAPTYKVLKVSPSMKRPPSSTVPQTFFRSSQGSHSSSSTPQKGTPQKKTPQKAPEGKWRPQKETSQEKPKEEDGWTTKGAPPKKEKKAKKTPCKTPPKRSDPPASDDGEDDGLADLIAWSKVKK